MIYKQEKIYSNGEQMGYHEEDNDIGRWSPGDSLGRAQHNVVGLNLLMRPQSLFCSVFFYYTQPIVEPNNFALL